MLSTEDYFFIGCVLIIAPFLVYAFYELFNIGIKSDPYLASLMGTIGLLMVIISIIR